MLGNTIFENKIVWTACVAINDHHQKGLKPDQAGCCRMHIEWLAGMIKEQILCIIERGYFLKCASDTN